MPLTTALRRAIATLAAAALAATAGCGTTDVHKQAPSNSPSPDAQGAQRQPGSGGRLLSADDTAQVVDAVRVLEGRCLGLGANGYAATEQQAVSTIAGIQRRVGADAVVDSGNAEAARTVADLMRFEAARLKRCNPAASAQLARSAA